MRVLRGNLFLDSGCVTIWVGLLALGLTARATAQEPRAWLTGAPFQRQLQSPVGLTWESNPLGEGLGSLARSQRVAIWLDRRVDPDQQVDYTATDATLDQALRALAKRLEIGVCYVGPVAYLGPRSVASKLPTLAALKQQEAGQLSASLGRHLAAEQPWQWADLETPRGLLDELVEQSRLEFQGLDLVPHDLWAARQLPPTSLAQRLSLVLAGFDLTFEFAPDGRMARLVPIPDEVMLQRTYAAKGNPRQFARELTDRFDVAGVTVNGNRMLVEASAEVHDQIERLLKGANPAPRSAGPVQKRYTLKVENQPVGGVAKALAERLNLRLQFDPRTKPQLGERISFQVEDATLDGLLQAVFQPVGLRYKRTEQVLEVIPGAP